MNLSSKESAKKLRAVGDRRFCAVGRLHYCIVPIAPSCHGVDGVYEPVDSEGCWCKRISSYVRLSRGIMGDRS
jgi:hypothetical protein